MLYRALLRSARDRPADPRRSRHPRDHPRCRPGGDHRRCRFRRREPSCGWRHRRGDVEDRVEGRGSRRSSWRPSSRRSSPVEWSATWDKDPAVTEVVLREAKRIVRQVGPVLITETQHGFVCANSGVDQSSSGAHGRVVVLPTDPDASARRIRAGLARAWCRRRRDHLRHIRSGMARGADRHRHRHRRDCSRSSATSDSSTHTGTSSRCRRCASPTSSPERRNW